MPKFLYCLECNEGIELEPKEIKECKCKNVKGRYINSQKAEICARNPKNAFFIGIDLNAECILLRILDKNSSELLSAIEETEEWKRFDKLKNEFLKIKSREAWEKWEKGHLVETCEKKEWDSLLCKEGYSIGTVVSLKEDKWPEEWKERWEYNQSICETR